MLRRTYVLLSMTSRTAKGDLRGKTKSQDPENKELKQGVFYVDRANKGLRNKFVIPLNLAAKMTKTGLNRRTSSPVLIEQIFKEHAQRSLFRSSISRVANKEKEPAKRGKTILPIVSAA